MKFIVTYDDKTEETIIAPNMLVAKIRTAIKSLFSKKSVDRIRYKDLYKNICILYEQNDPVLLYKDLTQYADISEIRNLEKLLKFYNIEYEKKQRNILTYINIKLSDEKYVEVLYILNRDNGIMYLNSVAFYLNDKCINVKGVL